MAETGYRRVDIGFAAGAVISFRLPKDEYDGLKSALSEEAAHKRWHEVNAEDAAVTIDLSQVIYVRLDTERGRVGF